MATSIYLGTVLLEPNRWTKDKEPSIVASEWTSRALAAGFDGIELWENHYAKAEAAEQEKLRALAKDGAQGEAEGGTALAIFNCYAGSENENVAQRKSATRSIVELGAPAIKFNAGGDMVRFDEYVANADEWARVLHGVKLLCECHPGSVLETPAAAARAFDTWDATRFGVMVHPFTTPPDELREWLRLLGRRVEHAHVQIRGDDGRPECLDQQPEAARAALQILREGGFPSSFTCEFTAGTSTANDRPEFLWEGALRDLAFLRENWG